jgi:sulfate transport system substrate-binding protein
VSEDPVKQVRWVAAVLALMLVSGACQPPEETSREPTRQTIVVYGFSVQEEVMTQDILPAFRSHWREQTGQEVNFQTVFTSSEEITEAIIGGARADVALLSNEQHAVWLRINDCVETDWHTFPNQGIISRSPMVIVVRSGNPLGIEDWADLTDPGVKLIQADPYASGGAQWALLAEYGSSLMLTGGSKEMACAQLRGIRANVIAAPASSREAFRQFVFGTGDALVTYEQDALLAQARGATLEIVVAPTTLVSEHSAVIVDCNVKPWERDVVEAFVDFLWSEDAQRAFTRYYFRAVTDEAFNDAVPEFHSIERSFTVQDLGGWGRAYPEVIHGAWTEQFTQR